MINARVPTQRTIQRGSGVGAIDNPLDRVLELGATDRRRTISLTLAAALLAHGGMAGAIHLRGEELAAGVDDVSAQELVIEREVLPTPPPPLPPPPLPAPLKITARMIAEAPPPEVPVDEPPASEAAQAGDVLVQEDEPDDEDEDDADDDTIVVGTADNFSGGVTAASGTSALAVHGTVVETGGVPGASGIRVAAPPPKPALRDRSRRAWLEGSTSWDCDFPGEADAAHIDHAAVAMSVMVSPSGKAYEVSILDDPGHGFARMASSCARKHKFAPALDGEGHTIWGRTPPFHVGFHR